MTEPTPFPGAYAASLWKGEIDYREGRPSPSRPADDDPCTSVESARYLGWMVARMRTVVRRRRAMEALGVED